MRCRALLALLGLSCATAGCAELAAERPGGVAAPPPVGQAATAPAPVGPAPTPASIPPAGASTAPVAEVAPPTRSASAESPRPGAADLPRPVVVSARTPEPTAHVPMSNLFVDQVPGQVAATPPEPTATPPSPRQPAARAVAPRVEVARPAPAPAMTPVPSPAPAPEASEGVVRGGEGRIAVLLPPADRRAGDRPAPATRVEDAAASSPAIRPAGPVVRDGTVVETSDAARLGTKPPGRAVARVGDEVITLPELTAAVKDRLRGLPDGQEPTRRQIVTLARSTLEAKIQRSLVWQEARRRFAASGGLDPVLAAIDRRWIDDELPRRVREEGALDEGDLAARLARRGQSLADLRERSRTRAMAVELMRAEPGGGPDRPTDCQVAAYLDGLRRRIRIASIMTQSEVAAASGDPAARGRGATAPPAAGEPGRDLP